LECFNKWLCASADAEAGAYLISKKKQKQNCVSADLSLTIYHLMAYCTFEPWGLEEEDKHS
jgi:hypothetical protein